MPILQVDNLGQGGIITDVPAHELPINAFSNGNNVRLEDDGIVRTLGDKTVLATTTADIFHLMPWQQPTTYKWFGFGSTDAYLYDATTETEVTRTTGGADYVAGTHPRWSGGVFGGIPIANHANLQATDYPQYYDDGGTNKFVDLTNWPVGAGGDPTWLCKVIRPFRNFLVALYTIEDSTTYPTRLRWSDSADPGTLPTTWIPAATNLAGSKPFSDTTAPLVDCLPMKDINVVYKEDSVHLMQFVGGTFVFNFRRAFSEFGALSMRAIKPFFGKHVVLSQGDIVLHDGQQAESIITKKLRRNLFTAISSDNYENAYIVAYPSREEMWVCVPINGSGTTAPTRAYIWNWRENQWTIRDLVNTPHIALGLVDESGLGVTFDDLADGAGSGSFDDRHGSFDQRTYNPSTQWLLGSDITANRLIKYDDPDSDTFHGTGFTSFVERTGLAINGLKGGEITVDPHTIKFVRRVYPKITADPGAVLTIKIGSQDHPGDTVTWTSYTFDPNSETYISCRTQGKLLAYRVENSTNHRWKLHSMGFDLDVIGWQ